ERSAIFVHENGGSFRHGSTRHEGCKVVQLGEPNRGRLRAVVPRVAVRVVVGIDAAFDRGAIELSTVWGSRGARAARAGGCEQGLCRDLAGVGAESVDASLNGARVHLARVYGR